MNALDWMNVVERAQRERPLKVSELVLWVQVWFLFNGRRVGQRWPESVMVSPRHLESLCTVSDKTLKAARDGLVRRGLIRFKVRGKRPARWEMWLREPELARRNDRNNSGIGIYKAEDTSYPEKSKSPLPPLPENFREPGKGKRERRGEAGERRASRNAFAMKELRIQIADLRAVLESDECRIRQPETAWVEANDLVREKRQRVRRQLTALETKLAEVREGACGAQVEVMN